ncbi:putative cupin superfamily protein [Agrobacterium vitis]|nr:putative cupin superfamily protein [Agrobacterium vitis]
MTVIQYIKNQRTEEGWMDFDPVENGARDIKGDFKAKSRIDFTAEKVVAGEYVQSPASAIIKWGFTEHAFVLEGSVTIKDMETGQSATYGVGDGWIIKEGSETEWTVTEPFRKAFMLHLP